MNKLDFAIIREERKIENIKNVEHALKTKDISIIKKECNIKELTRILLHLELTFEQLLEQCDHPYFSKLLYSTVSKAASRQSMTDELLMITRCNEIGSLYNVKVRNLSNTAFRPTKCGKIVSKKMMKKQNLTLLDCLKSFDAKITGQIKGWMICKISYSKGGFQDSVFEEIKTLCEWVSTYGKRTDIYVFLIESDSTEKIQQLKRQYKRKNILITNVEGYQTYLEKNLNIKL